MKVKSKKFARIVISFLRADAVNLTTLKISNALSRQKQVLRFCLYLPLIRKFRISH